MGHDTIYTAGMPSIADRMASLLESDSDIEQLLKDVESEVAAMKKQLRGLSDKVKTVAKANNKWEDDPNGGRPINRNPYGSALESLAYALASHDLDFDRNIAGVRKAKK